MSRIQNTKRRAEAPVEKRPEKKHKSEKHADGTTGKPRQAQAHSVLRDDEATFPRGGANVLTPLEQRQIQIKAKQDVLFEQSTGKKAPAGIDSDDDSDGIAKGQPRTGTKAGKKDKKKSKSKDKKSKNEASAIADTGPKIEGLSYKRLVKSSIILGQISQINKYDATVTLPNSLTGYLPLTAISDKTTQAVEALAAEDEDEENDEVESIRLGDYLRVGQYLRVCVTKIGADGDNSKEKSKRHITLSAMPDQVNGELKKSELIRDNVVQASIESVEDHGLVMNVGTGDSGITGFISSGELPSDVKLSELKPGALMLCLVLGLNSNGKVVKLSANTEKLGNLKKGGYLSGAPSVDTFLPGCAVDVLVSEVTDAGLIGKVMGLLDVTADWIHSTRDLAQKPLAKRHPVGSQVKARVICTFPTSDSKKLGVSLLPHLLTLSTQTPKHSEQTPPQILSISSFVEEAKVISVEATTGLVLDVSVKGVPGYAHISRLSDEKVTSISADSGPYKVGSTHRARIIGYNSLDGQFIVSLQASTLSTPFLRYEDVAVGSVVTGKVEKVAVDASGKSYLLLELADGISGLVRELHLSDVHLHNPQQRFKLGSKVSARVLTVDVENKKIVLTCKKSLVNSDAPVWKTFADPQIGQSSPGTIVSVQSSGAVVAYYGNVRGFLPTAQMSEAFIDDPRQHFKVGQVVTTHPTSVEPEEEKMSVSCRELSASGPEKRKALEDLQAGSLVSGTVSEKLQDRLVVQLEPSGLTATLSVEHLADGSAKKCANKAEKIRVGQTLSGLLVLRKNMGYQRVEVSGKPALLKAIAASAGKLPNKLEDLDIGKELVGFVGSITKTAVFVRFVGGLTGLLPVNALEADSAEPLNFGLREGATITSKVASIDAVNKKFTLTQKTTPSSEERSKYANGTSQMQSQPLVNTVDGVPRSTTDFEIGTKTEVKIQSVKETQLNVFLADNLPGRIDVSQLYDSWDDIKDRKNPLGKFSAGQKLPVRVLGQHDHRNHRFLPLTHAGKSLVLELTAKPSDLNGEKLHILTIADVQVGQEYVCFVNNIKDDMLYVNISPNVRGRIDRLHVSDNITSMQHLEDSFPVGSAIRAHVTQVDAENGRLDLSARAQPQSLSDLSEGMILAAKVTRITERQVTMQISDNIAGPVNLVELDDDYSNSNPGRYTIGDVVRVHVTTVDVSNKRLALSTRPSKVLSSTLPVTDRDYKKPEELHVGDIVRGFIKSVAENGLFVALSTKITAFVPVRELSDNFLADWKASHESDELVKGRITAIDAAANRIQMSLKSSALKANYKPSLGWSDLKAGQIVTATVKKIEEYGVFILVDNSQNVSGLVHKSEMADELVSDVKKLYNVGDAVKAKVLKVDLKKPRKTASFGLKASYFRDTDAIDVDEDDEADSEDALDEGVEVPDNEDDQDSDGGVGDTFEDLDDDNDLDDEGIDITAQLQAARNGAASLDGGLNVGGLTTTNGLNVGEFDWTGNKRQFDTVDLTQDSDSEDEPQKKKRRKAQIQVDRTAELDVNGPQSTADFERLLMTEPNRSDLWVAYMGYYLQLNDLSKARDIAERAIKTVNHQSRDTEEDALNVWTAYLNLENAYGNDETLEAVFARAKQYNDAKEIHSRLVSIYIQSSKQEQAEALLQTMVKKFSEDPAVWLNYATFLFGTKKQPVEGRELLKRALQALRRDNHFDTTVKFAQLEFRSEQGDKERGRTMLEGLINAFPKRTDLYNVYLDVEIKVGDKETVRRLFARATNSIYLKPKTAKHFFKRWDEWEVKNGDAKSVEKVKAKAEEWVRKHMESKDNK